MSPTGYVEGVDRSDDADRLVSHLYKGSFDDIEGPMCVRGWNRSGGFRFSIFRNNTSPAGTCAVCLRRAREGKAPVPPRKRKTKYL